MLLIRLFQPTKCMYCDIAVKCFLLNKYKIYLDNLPLILDISDSIYVYVMRVIIYDDGFDVESWA